jgi:hypothetical protein
MPEPTRETELAFENIKLATALRMAEGREVGEESLRAWDRLIAEKDSLRRALVHIHRICIEEKDAVAAATKAAYIAENELMGRNA